MNPRLEAFKVGELRIGQAVIALPDLAKVLIVFVVRRVPREMRAREKKLRGSPWNRHRRL